MGKFGKVNPLPEDPASTQKIAMAPRSDAEVIAEERKRKEKRLKEDREARINRHIPKHDVTVDSSDHPVKPMTVPEELPLRVSESAYASNDAKKKVVVPEKQTITIDLGDMTPEMKAEGSVTESEDLEESEIPETL